MVAALKNVDFPQLGLPARARVIMCGSSVTYPVLLSVWSDVNQIHFFHLANPAHFPCGKSETFSRSHEKMTDFTLVQNLTKFFMPAY